MDEDSEYMVQPVVKAMQVLECVARQGHAMTLTEIVHELKLPKTTVFRYLQTLSATGFIAHDVRRDRYELGGKVHDLSRLDHAMRGLRDIAHPEMDQLVQTFDETVNLGILSRGHVLYIDILSPSRPMRAAAKVGLRHPAHSTSLGKAILAFLPENEAALEPALPQMTMRTLTDAGKLRRQTEDIRRRGYAVEVGENEEGLMCVGVPILDQSGYPVAALSLSAPERRMRLERTNLAAEALRAASWRISHRMRAEGAA